MKGWLFRVVTTHNTQSFPYLHVVGEGMPSPYVRVYLIDKLKFEFSVSNREEALDDRLPGSPELSAATRR